MPKHLDESTLPGDWFSDLGYHGFGRVTSGLCYSVRLSVDSTQHEIARCKSQHDAAKAYDAALWRLSAFAPVYAKPNFPDDFNLITLDDVLALCPHADKIYNDCIERLQTNGVNLVEFFKLKALQREQYKQSDKEKVNLSRRDEYAALETRASRMFIALTDYSVKFSNDVGHLKLQKLPQVAADLQNFNSRLSALITELGALLESLKTNHVVYGKFREL